MSGTFERCTGLHRGGDSCTSEKGHRGACTFGLDVEPKRRMSGSEMETQTQQAWLQQIADEYAARLFEEGHYPNPVGHGFVGCESCRLAEALRQALDALAVLSAGGEG